MRVYTAQIISVPLLCKHLKSIPFRRNSNRYRSKQFQCESFLHLSQLCFSTAIRHVSFPLRCLTSLILCDSYPFRNKSCHHLAYAISYYSFPPQGISSMCDSNAYLCCPNYSVTGLCEPMPFFSMTAPLVSMRSFPVAPPVSLNPCASVTLHFRS